VAGVVREIRMMHTVVETFDGKTAYIPNSSISGSRVVNMTRLGRRRVEISVSASMSCGQKICYPGGTKQFFELFQNSL